MTTDVKALSNTLSWLKLKQQPKITLFPMGQWHFDPSVFLIIKQKLEVLIQLNIPIILACEYPNELSLADIINNLLAQIKLASQADHKSLPPQVRAGLGANKALLDLLFFVKQHTISYFGLDCDSATTQKLLQSGFSESSFMALEKQRMETMSTHTIAAMNTLKRTGGVLFIAQLGLVHAHRLAAYIKIKLQNSPLIESNEIEIITTRTFPETQKKLAEEQLAISNRTDDATIKAAYKFIPCVNLTVKKKRNSPNIYSPEFNVVFNQGFGRIELEIPDASLDVLKKLQDVLGSFRDDENIIEFAAQDKKVSFPVLWLKDVQKVNPEGIVYLAKELMISAEDFQSKITKATANSFSSDRLK
jgi:hypothetical protein